MDFGVTEKVLFTLLVVVCLNVDNMLLASFPIATFKVTGTMELIHASRATGWSHCSGSVGTKDTSGRILFRSHP